MKKILFPFSDWSQPEFFMDCVNIATLKIFVCAAFSKNMDTGEEISVYASKTSSSDAKRWAYMELLKKITTLHDPSLLPIGSTLADGAPKIFTFSRTNGVSIHFRKSIACQNAKFELIERDRILRSWYGQITPQKLHFSQQEDEKLAEFYNTSKYLFRLRDADQFYTCGYFGFPKDPYRHPLFFGFGSGHNLVTACKTAAEAALHRLARLWSLPIPHQPPRFTPTADFHQDYFLLPTNHEKIKDWLSGRNSEQRLYFRPEYMLVKDFKTDYFDITPAVFKKKFFVIKAESIQTIPLWFGKPDAFLAPANPRISIHPIA